MDHPERNHGTCKQFGIPVYATASSAIYEIPTVNTDIEAAAWAIYDATRTTPHDSSNITKNTTTSGTFNIHVQLCIPNPSGTGNTLQIATHGAHFDSRYWDSAYQPENHSYVDAALAAGYSILTYDRLGTGQSDILDAYTVVQAPLELEIMRQLTLMARNGTLYSLASTSGPAHLPFQALSKPSKIVHVGHSFGSFLTSAFITNYGTLTDGAIITGYLLTKYLASAGSTSWAVEYPGSSCPPFDRPSGYVVCKKVGIQNLFFGGNTSTAYTPALLDYGNSIKQPAPIGEIASAFWLLGNYGPSFTGPVQYFLSEFDFYVCRGDCKGLADVTQLAQTFPNASAIEVAIQPNTGHALSLHNNASAGFEGWANPAGDEFFRLQRQTADQARENTETAGAFYRMMRNIAQDLHWANGVFDVLTSSAEKPTILDLCMAPGGFLETAMRHDSRSRATAFSLATAQGGHEIFLSQNPKVKVKLMDITMLAADMGVTSIPDTHPDRANFLPRELPPGELVDLVICDGQVLRTHARAEYREGREATRLMLTQLALGLEHLTPGGAMVGLLHKFEAWNTVCLLGKFDQFASIKLFKHAKCHAKRSSLYMIATQVDTRCQQADFKEAIRASEADVQSILTEFGARLTEIGRPIFDIQAKALEKASFNRR
ncbi:hypothetical protein B0A55_12430 [Friedmanniomyces simplex]|uniref:Ribosomal RNA methyltransferase FtsJ domain-containing protein n=1 Tax=Friedmanniomyces simplex TaxID=329884 RepID=A0A4U0WMQ0_9PEZI|nr:hypothetical protein B0A55_12430 [Friedmanniomyces simplex]